MEDTMYYQTFSLKNRRNFNRNWCAACIVHIPTWRALAARWGHCGILPIMEALETCLGVVMIDSAHLVACGENDANFEFQAWEREYSSLRHRKTFSNNYSPRFWPQKLLLDIHLNSRCQMEIWTQKNPPGPSVFVCGIVGISFEFLVP